MEQKEIISYRQLEPSGSCTDIVDSFWEFQNRGEQALPHTIFPDSYFKVVLQHVDGQIIAYFLTGLWPKETEIMIPARSTTIGIRFKILAPEYLFQRGVGSLSGIIEPLEHSFWNADKFDLGSFEDVVEQFDKVIDQQFAGRESIDDKKLRLSNLLYASNGNITVGEVSDQIEWSERQINRYMNKYLGVSLKAYLNIQKCYAAYIQIREGRFFPDDGYFDQAHFIREVRKHTNHTPKELHKEQDDRFVQLKHIRKK